MQQYARQTKEILDFIDRQCLRLSDILSKAAAKTTKEQFTKRLDLFLKLIAVGMIAVAAVIVAVGKGHAAEDTAIQREEKRMTDTGDEISRAVQQALEAEKKPEPSKSADNGASVKPEEQQEKQPSGGK
jgi:hypothetical protein